MYVNGIICHYHLGLSPREEMTVCCFLLSLNTVTSLKWMVFRMFDNVLALSSLATRIKSLSSFASWVDKLIMSSEWWNYDRKQQRETSVTVQLSPPWRQHVSCQSRCFGPTRNRVNSYAITVTQSTSAQADLYVHPWEYWTQSCKTAKWMHFIHTGSFR